MDGFAFASGYRLLLARVDDHGNSLDRLYRVVVVSVVEVFVDGLYLLLAANGSCSVEADRVVLFGAMFFEVVVVAAAGEPNIKLLFEY